MHGLFLWKTKKGTTISNAFQNILDESNWKPNQIWVDKGSKTIDQWNHFRRIMIQKCIKHIMKKNLSLLKGLLTPDRLRYLCYKSITSQNVSSTAQINNFFICRKIMFHSQDNQVFVFLTVPWFTKSVTSRWVLVHEIRCIFEYIFWTTNYEVTKLSQSIDIS